MTSERIHLREPVQIMDDHAQIECSIEEQQRVSFRRPLLVVIVIGFCFAVVTCVTFYRMKQRRSPGPVVEGRTLEEWLDDKVQLPNGQKKVLTPEAIAVVRKLGSDAIPTLMEWLKTNDEPSFQMFGRQYTLGVPHARRCRERAIDGLLALDQAIAPAIPELVKLTLDHQNAAVSCAARECLGNNKPLSTRLLIESLDSKDIKTRNSAFFELGTSQPREAIRPLTLRLRDQNAFVRAYAAFNLGRFNYLLPDETQDQLKNCLNDIDLDVKFAAQEALEKQMLKRRLNRSKLPQK